MTPSEQAERKTMSKLTKDVILDRYMLSRRKHKAAEEMLIEKEPKHKAELKKSRDFFRECIAKNEKIYEESSSYKYVTQLLLDLKFANSDLEYANGRVKDLEENHHNLLKAENAELKNTIVRMAMI
jgi:hypothetical protein